MNHVFRKINPRNVAIRYAHTISITLAQTRSEDFTFFSGISVNDLHSLIMSREVERRPNRCWWRSTVNQLMSVAKFSQKLTEVGKMELYF